ncbi:hypothetical protein SAMN04487948_101171 [Halogranum amylolyticum]|uniref:Uncharacterized protein n=1 Tax=Halogranum amylolyticum TaxID=660520 RepID=A0A1H8MY25_9EURY|nr:hypothetical protein [Halogranum amylolyticum]SEO22169.1 hypothetical protein SAMN04487948_101171 [Halogranum amylolyticum]
MAYEMHDPVWTGTAYTHDGVQRVGDDGNTERFSAVADHYLLSASGFPPEWPTDLELKIVDEEMNLNRELLRSARTRLEQLDDLDPEPKAVVDDRLTTLLAEHFEDAGFE